MLVDRASFPRDKVCGDFVGPMALAELADLGVAQTEAFAATSTMARLALHIDADQPAVMSIPKVDGIPGYGRVIPRLQLDAWILDAARRAGATVLDGRKAEAVEQAPDADHGPGPQRGRPVAAARPAAAGSRRQQLDGGPDAARRRAAQPGPDHGRAGLLR